MYISPHRVVIYWRIKLTLYPVSIVVNFPLYGLGSNLISRTYYLYTSEGYSIALCMLDPLFHTSDLFYSGLPKFVHLCQNTYLLDASTYLFQEIRPVTWSKDKIDLVS